MFLSKPERFCRKRPLLYSEATYRKLALMSAGKDSNHPRLVYCGRVHPPGCASWLEEKGREREGVEREGKAVHMPGAWETGLSLSRCWTKGEPVILLFSLYSLLELQLKEVQKGTGPTSRITGLLNSKKYSPKH